MSAGRASLCAETMRGLAGDLLVVVDAAGALLHTAFLGRGGPAARDRALRRLGAPVVHAAGATGPAAGQLREYLAGHRRTFELRIAPRGTPFQRAVWDALGAIPYGETRTYGQLARGLSRPAAARAVGGASAANPIPIVIPCHRLVGHDGSLTGFGGGLAMKAALLDLERGAGAAGATRS